ncbi:MAG: hypothetical protein ACREUQ_05860 [Burkholderiales bacterium]
MTHPLVRSLITTLVAATALAACTPLTQYRTTYEVCVSDTLPPPAQCETHALQQLPARDGSRFLLGFIEFDDQGQLWDRKQMWAVLDKFAAESASKDLLMVVFVHGWKHSAAPYDPNIETFRSVLAELSGAEKQISGVTGEPQRLVAGVYFGWRGASATLPLIKELSFWERKNTAQKVGQVGVTEVLNRLEQIRRTKDSIGGDGSRTRLIVVGHSFGGALVHSALASALESGFVHSTGPDGTVSDVAGFGNLVVLINPAFEALLFAPLSDMSTERGTYFGQQLPVLAVLTSEADYATRFAFPAGRVVSTFFEKERSIRRYNAVTRTDEVIDEEDANRSAVGHFEAYRTHRLYPTGERTREQAGELESADNFALLQKFSQSWVSDQPGSKIAFDSLTLERTVTSAGRNPYLVTYVDRQLIRDHNDIADWRVINFLKQLILLSSQRPQDVQKILRMKQDRAK